jgi:ATP-dependent DNA helicase RecG
LDFGIWNFLELCVLDFELSIPWVSCFAVEAPPFHRYRAGVTPTEHPPADAPLAAPVNSLWGVGGERTQQLARLKIFTVGDLLLHAPRRYEDRRHFRTIAELTKAEAATTRGTIVALGLKRFHHGQKSVFEIILDDGTARLHCRWWNLPFMQNYFAVGDEVFVYGKLLETKPRTVDHPETEVIEAGEESSIHINRIAPIYPLTEGLPQRWLRGLLWRALARCENLIAEPWPGLAPVALPARANAIHMLHFPEDFADAELARQRLALDEFVELQRQIRWRRKNFEAHARGLPCGGDNRWMRPFLAGLGFKLTAAQTRVLREIRADLTGAHPMRRLLQGDVGSGKTAVAACAALMALESGYRVVLMAPTEILAEQHGRNFTHWFTPFGVRVELQTGSHKPGVPAPKPAPPGGDGALRRPDEPLADAAGPAPAPAGAEPVVYIGTHALIETGFTVENPGLVIIDEQHKFGVAQREELLRKGHFPHLLVMTATPIPRTLGLTLYGDLDVSVIDELPGGRGRIKTFVRAADKLPKVWEFIREKLAAGRQAYIVYSRVDAADATLDLKAVTKELAQVQKALAPFRVGLLHGRLKPAEKEAVMAEFRANTVQALVATALIEVGVDVPNATIMLVENAERFGLAQLHQLRGRIGRGAHESHCILISGAKTPEARERLRVLEQTTDGFKIAEADLRLRGPGELLGRDQSGLPDLRFGRLTEDLDLIRQARDLAAKLV